MKLFKESWQDTDKKRFKKWKRTTGWLA